MLEFLVGLVLEMILQVFAEVVFAIGVHALARPLGELPMPSLVGVGYAIAGVALGGLSAFVLPNYFINLPALRLVNLALTPVLVGLLMGVIGRLRAQRGKQVFRIEHFSYGYVFALAFGAARLLLAHQQAIST
jgi:hypothetical protein